MTQDTEAFEPSSEGTAIDSWLRATVYGEDKEEEIRARLRSEVPPLLSLVVRGGCAVQCSHCIFPFEGPKGYSERFSAEILISVLKQLTGPGHLVHEGRQLLPHQVPVLAAIKQAGYGISVISNGQYATPAMLSLCEREGLEVDTLDVSVDGTERTHNAQRSSQQAWTWAMKGLTNARRLVGPNGKVTSLYTLSSLNCDDVRETGEVLTPLVDEWHLTTLTSRPGIEHMRPDKRQLATALEQLLGSRWERPVYLRTYSLADFVSLLEILGVETAREALTKAMVIYNGLVLDIGIPLYFFPVSLVVNEILVIDADGWWRLPSAIQHQLKDLQSGLDATGKNLSHLSIAPVSKELDIPSVFADATETWWATLGRSAFSAERAAVQRFLG